MIALNPLWLICASNGPKKSNLDPEVPSNIWHQLNDVGVFDLIRFRKMTRIQFLKTLIVGLEILSPDEIKMFAKDLTQNYFGQDYDNPKRVTSDKQIVKMENFWVKSPFKTNEISMETLLNDKASADVRFISKNETNEMVEEISAHKCILANERDVFANQFINPTNLTNEIPIIGISADIFKYFLRTIYVVKKPHFFGILKHEFLTY